MTTEEVKAEIASQIGKAEHLKRIIVERLPEVGTADTNAIYMVSKDPVSYTHLTLPTNSLV